MFEPSVVFIASLIFALSSLNKTVKKFIPDQSNISKHISDLKNINLKLWDIEDGNST